MPRQIMEVEYINGEKEEVIADRLITKSNRHYLYYGKDLVKDVPMSEVRMIKTVMSTRSLGDLVEELKEEKKYVAE